MASFIGAKSVKHRMAAKIAFDVCVVHGRKLLVFLEWPMTQWLIELFLVN